MVEEEGRGSKARGERELAEGGDWVGDESVGEVEGEGLDLGEGEVGGDAKALISDREEQRSVKGRKEDAN